VLSPGAVFWFTNSLALTAEEGGLKGGSQGRRKAVLFNARAGVSH